MLKLKSAGKKLISHIAGQEIYFKLRWLVKYGWRYFPIACYWDLDGWLSEKEAMALYTIAYTLPQENPLVVEIGSWMGKSSVILAKGIRKKRQPVLYCIDPFDASGDALEQQDYKKKAEKIEGNLKENFIKNIKKCGVGKYIRILEGKSYDFADKWREKIDFLFIDANHSYAAVLQDFLSWSKFIKSAGYVAFHDVCIGPARREIYQGGPYRVVKEQILNSPQWTEKRFVDSLFYAKKI